MEWETPPDSGVLLTFACGIPTRQTRTSEEHDLESPFRELTSDVAISASYSLAGGVIRGCLPRYATAKSQPLERRRI